MNETDDQQNRHKIDQGDGVAVGVHALMEVVGDGLHHRIAVISEGIDDGIDDHHQNGGGNERESDFPCLLYTSDAADE